MMWLIISTACIMFIIGVVIGFFIALITVGDNSDIDSGIKD